MKKIGTFKIDELSFLKRGERMLENKPNKREVELAAQVWCKPEVEDRGMDPGLAYAFADTLRDYRYELTKTAEIFDYYKVTVKEAGDIFDRIIDWAEDIDYSDGSDVDNIKDEIIELFKGREIPVEEALDILGGLSELISLKGMEGQDGAMDLISSWGEGQQSAGASSAPTYPESFESVRGLGGGLGDAGSAAPTSGGAMEAGAVPGFGSSGHAFDFGPAGGVGLPSPGTSGYTPSTIFEGPEHSYSVTPGESTETLIMKEKGEPVPFGHSYEAGTLLVP